MQPDGRTLRLSLAGESKEDYLSAVLSHVAWMADTTVRNDHRSFKLCQGFIMFHPLICPALTRTATSLCIPSLRPSSVERPKPQTYSSPSGIHSLPVIKTRAQMR